jgi:hypothetical protein
LVLFSDLLIGSYLLKIREGWQCGSMIDHLPGMHEALSLIPNIGRNKKKKKKEREGN